MLQTHILFTWIDKHGPMDDDSDDIYGYVKRYAKPPPSHVIPILPLFAGSIPSLRTTSESTRTTSDSKPELDPPQLSILGESLSELGDRSSPCPRTKGNRPGQTTGQSDKSNYIDLSSHILTKHERE